MRQHRTGISLLLLLLVLLALSALFYHATIWYFPSHIHAWTQSDRYALALQFLENGLNLFRPQTFNLQTVEGVTAVDLPLPEWLVAIWMKLLGSRAAGIFRLHSLLVMLLGYVALFLTTLRLTQSVGKAWFVVIWSFSLPVVTYYQAGFIPSTFALSLALGSHFFWLRHLQEGSKRDFWLTLGLLCLASLVRKPFFIGLFALFLQHAYEALKRRQFRRQELVGFGLAFGVFAAYQAYQAWMASTYGSMFLTFLLPPRSWHELWEVLGEVYQNWRFQYFTPCHYLGMLLVLLAWRLGTTASPSAAQKKLTRHAALWLLGGAVYFLLMARQFVAHEYYFIDAFYPGIILGMGVLLSRGSFRDRWQRVWMGSLAGLLLLGAIWQSQDIQQTKYRVLDRGEITRKNFAGADKWLDSLGVARDARMLVLDAYSTNAPLIQMNRSGYTVLITRDSTLRKALTLDADYVVIQDEFLPSEVVRPFPEIMQRLRRVGGNGRLSLFVQDEDQGEQSLADMLGIRPDAIYLEDSLVFGADSAYAMGDRWAANVDQEDGAGILLPGTTFGPTFSYTPGHWGANRLLVEGNMVGAGERCRAKLAVSLELQGDLYHYQDYDLWLGGGEREMQAFLFVLPDFIPAQASLKCYLWNPDGCQASLEAFHLTLYAP